MLLVYVYLWSILLSYNMYVEIIEAENAVVPGADRTWRGNLIPEGGAYWQK
jgi:hypothetical protein